MAVLMADSLINFLSQEIYFLLVWEIMILRGDAISLLIFIEKED